MGKSTDRYIAFIQGSADKRNMMKPIATITIDNEAVIYVTKCNKFNIQISMGDSISCQQYLSLICFSYRRDEDFKN